MNFDERAKLFRDIVLDVSKRLDVAIAHQYDTRGGTFLLVPYHSGLAKLFEDALIRTPKPDDR